MTGLYEFERNSSFDSALQRALGTGIHSFLVEQTHQASGAERWVFMCWRRKRKEWSEHQVVVHILPNGKILVGCDCPAGDFLRPCTHVAGILMVYKRLISKKETEHAAEHK